MGIFGNAFGWPHLIVILVIVLLLFGAPKLPALARSIGQSMKIFKQEIKPDKSDSEARDAEAAAVYTEEPPASERAKAAEKPAPKPKL